MARFEEPTPQQKAGWREWVASRPPNVRAVAERFDPWSLYRLKPDGHRVTLYSLGEHEDGSVTVTVDVLGQFNLVPFERRVFGIPPGDLEPCDLPADGEPVGAVLTDEDEIDAFIDEVRPEVLAKRNPN
jgi:hypothetical protein